VPGVCDVPLNRAIVQYRDVHETEPPDGRIRDIGLAVVVEGRFASAVRAIDLGSAETRVLDLSSELVVLDWLHEPTLAHVRRLANTARDSPSAQANLGRYCFRLAIRVLARRGFTPLTRPTLLRIGYRDLCRDLDMHEGTAFRVTSPREKRVRVRLDCDGSVLVFETSPPGPDPALEAALREVFPGLATSPPDAKDSGGSAAAYRVRFDVPCDFGEVLGCLRRIRYGLGHLLARFEPERFRALTAMVSALGERRTLDQLGSQIAAPGSGQPPGGEFSRSVGTETLSQPKGPSTLVH